MRKYKARLTKQDKKIGNRIQKLRKERQLTQEDLADKVNVTAQHLSYIENGHRRPSLPLARKLARVLKATLGDLLSQ
jgi:DNA-binding XRE family transcriptional regulator